MTGKSYSRFIIILFWFTNKTQVSRAHYSTNPTKKNNPSLSLSRLLQACNFLNQDSFMFHPYLRKLKFRNVRKNTGYRGEIGALDSCDCSQEQHMHYTKTPGPTGTQAYSHEFPVTSQRTKHQSTSVKLVLQRVVGKKPGIRAMQQAYYFKYYD